MLISLTSGLYVVGNILYMPVYKDFLYKNFQWPDRCQKRTFLSSKSIYAGGFFMPPPDLCYVDF